MADIKQTGNVPSIWPNRMIRPVGDARNALQKKQKSKKERKSEQEDDVEKNSKLDDDNEGIDEYV